MRTRLTFLATFALFTACGGSRQGSEAVGAVAAIQAGYTAPTQHDYRGPSSVYLADGRILAVSMGGAEIYDPAANAWTQTGPMNQYRTAFSLVRLADGRVLAAGGWGTPGTTAEIFNPATGA